MKNGILKVCAAALALGMVGANACALPIDAESGSFEFNGTNAATGIAATVNAESVHLLAETAEGGYAVFAEDGFYTVEAEAIAPLLAAVPEEEALPMLEDYETLSRGAHGEEVRRLQNDLIALDLMSDYADGDFGGMSEQAILAFQQAHGLEQTGEADAMLQLLIHSLTLEPATAPGFSTAASSFELIRDKLSIDVDVLDESGLSLAYDDITGRGFISNGSAINVDASGAADIDLYDFTFRFGFAVDNVDADAVGIVPEIMIDCLCVRRPMMQEILLKSGDSRATLVVEDLENALDGARSIESGVVYLNDEASALLAKAAENGELKLRVSGKYNQYDIDIPVHELPGIAAVGKTVAALKGE